MVFWVKDSTIGIAWKIRELPETANFDDLIVFILSKKNLRVSPNWVLIRQLDGSLINDRGIKVPVCSSSSNPFVYTLHPVIAGSVVTEIKFIKTLESLLAVSVCQDVRLVNSNVVNGNTIVMGGVVVPSWLAESLPMRCTPFVDERKESLVDLSLPVPSNPFHIAMMNTQRDSQMIKGLISHSDWPSQMNHILLVGSSGCGKTSAVFELATHKYVIFLECPREDSSSCVSCGFRMNTAMWHKISNTLGGVQHALFCEVAARLTVLHHLLEKFGNDLTPLRWLMFVLSDEGHVHIGNVLQRFICEGLGVEGALVNVLLDRIHAKVGHVPVLVVDELQRLEKPRVNCDGNQISGMTAIVMVAKVLECCAVWVGTRLGITATDTPDSNIVKLFAGQSRQLKVLGDFEYLSPEKVIALFKRIFTTTASTATLLQLGHLLQGRARILASFVAYLLIPKGAAMQSADLSDEVLRAALESYMATLVVPSFQGEITSLFQKGLMTDENLGFIWCHSMLRNFYNAQIACVADRTNSLAFTMHTKKVETTYNEMWKESAADGESVVCAPYEFVHVFGEPGLQEALLRIVWNGGKALVDPGIREILNGAVSGSILNNCVALALLSRRTTLLRDLCGEHVKLKKFADHQLHIKRVVSIEHAEQQLEWLTRVVSDPEDCEFSLLKGVPVKNIILLPSVQSGADFICVATRVNDAAAGPELVVYTLPSVTRKRTRALELKTGDVETVEASPVDLVFVIVCCASYIDEVIDNKHNKRSMMLLEDQFLDAKGGRYGEDYRELASLHQFQYLPIIVELPGRRDAATNIDDRYVYITEGEATKLFSQQVLDAILSVVG